MSALDRQINLLPQQEYRDVVREKRTRTVSSGLLLFFLLLALSAFGIWSAAFVISQNIEKTKQHIHSLEQSLASLSQKEQQVQLLANRLEGATSIVASRPEFEKELDQLVGAIPIDVSIISAEFPDSGKTVALKLVSKTYAGFKDVLSVLRDGSFPRVEIDQLSRDHIGLYTIDLTMTLP